MVGKSRRGGGPFKGAGAVRLFFEVEKNHENNKKGKIRPSLRVYTLSEIIDIFDRQYFPYYFFLSIP